MWQLPALDLLLTADLSLVMCRGLVMKKADARPTPTDPRQAGSGVQLGPPAGHGDQLRPHGGGQLVLKLLPFRRARSSTAPEQRAGPMLLAPRCSAPRTRPAATLPLCLGATGASHGPPRSSRSVQGGWPLSVCSDQPAKRPAWRSTGPGCPLLRSSHCSTCLSSTAPLLAQALRSCPAGGRGSWAPTSTH